MSFRSRLTACFAAILLFAAAPAPLSFAQSSGASGPVIVFAAASLKNAMDDIAAAWQKETGNAAKISYAASSTLAKQIEEDAPAQIFISADEQWMDYLAGKGLIKPESRSDLLGNKLVLIAPKNSAVALTLQPGADLAKALNGGRLALGTVNSVPAGIYAKAALQKLGLWESVAGQLAQAENVRAALLLVSRGEAPLGIVYRTDAASDPSVKIVATFPADSHPPIVYPVALTKNAGAPAAAFLAFIKSVNSAPFFRAQGFTVLSEK
jgi:molybdate transport system substrate-binding protein